MEETPPGIRRVCMAVDVEHPSERSGTELIAARWQLSELLADMCDSPGFGDLLLYQQSADDGEVVVLPVGIDEPRTVTLLLNWLERALRRGRGQERPQVRLRVAVHEGITMLIGGVFEGPAVRQARRLVGALPLSRALTSRPAANLAVLFSDRIYADLGEFGQCLPPDEVVLVQVSDPAARSREVGWLLVSERDWPDGEGIPPGRSE